jgi:hypothetical protein
MTPLRPCRLPCCLVTLLLLAACRGEPSTAPTVEIAASPALAQLVTEDVDRFWRAYENGGRSGSASAFQQRYLDSASAGLRDFIGLRQLSAASLAQVATAYPAYLDALHAWWRTTPDRATVLNTIRANYGKIQALYPEAVFPPVTILVGRFSTGGTANDRGLLIGLEFFGRDAQAPLGALPAPVRENQKSWVHDLPPFVAHEYVHFLQIRARNFSGRDGATLLARSLNEGIAEFIGALAAGEPTYRDFFRVWQADEATYFAEFLREKDGTDISRWLYNQGRTAPGRPGDLGYFIGYRIAQAYYLKATDKAQAIRDLITLRDPAALLAQSGYAGSGPPIP